jgi:hypothetical protein
VLQVGAETLGLQSGPGDVLSHAVGVGGPLGEFGCVERELLLHALDDGFGDEEEDLGSGLIYVLRRVVIKVEMGMGNNGESEMRIGNSQFRRRPGTC